MQYTNEMIGARIERAYKEEFGMNSGGMCSSAATQADMPARLPQIPEQYERLSRELEKQRGMLDSLSARLEPVMSPEPPTAKGDSVEKNGPACGLAAGLHGLVDNLRRNSSVIEMLLRRLEV